MMRALAIKLALGWVVAFAALIAVFGCPRAAMAEDELNVEEMLKRPAVKLVAVDFYATWCKPCMAAIPKWKKLQDKYRQAGLRLVVVSVQSEGGCAKPEWAPDMIVCDAEGTLAKTWKATNLPQAFLWSWQGNLLVKNGHAEDVEAAIEAYFKNVPRIMLDDPIAIDGKALPPKVGDELKRMVRSELSRAAKFDLLPDEKERQALKEARRKASSANFDEQSSCHLGDEVSPNSVLRIHAGDTKLRLELFSLEKGCLTASAYVPASKADYQPAVVEAVYKLISQLTKGDEITKPGQAPAQAAPVAMVEQARDPDTFKAANIKLDSDPRGARVYFRGTKVCDGTPCTAEVAEGPGTFAFKKDRYEDYTQKIDVKAGMDVVKVTLSPSFGWLTVTSDPPSMDVKLLGLSIGVTPITRKELDPGSYRIEVGNKVYYADSQSVQIQKNQEAKLNFNMNAKKGMLKVTAKYEGAGAINGKVFFDNEEIGKTGDVFKVVCGEHNVDVKTEKGNTSRKVTIAENEQNDLEVTISKPYTPSYSSSRPSYSGGGGDAAKYFGIGRDLKGTAFWMGVGPLILPKVNYNIEIVDFSYFFLSGDWAAFGIGAEGMQIAGNWYEGEKTTSVTSGATTVKTKHKKKFTTMKTSVLPVGLSFRLGRFFFSTKVHWLSGDLKNKFKYLPTMSFDMKFPIWTNQDSGSRRGDTSWIPLPAFFCDTPLKKFGGKDGYYASSFTKGSMVCGLNIWFGAMLGD